MRIQPPSNNEFRRGETNVRPAASRCDMPSRRSIASRISITPSSASAPRIKAMSQLASRGRAVYAERSISFSVRLDVGAAYELGVLDDFSLQETRKLLRSAADELGPFLCKIVFELGRVDRLQNRGI